MKQLKLKLMLAFSGIVISLVMLGTATYAWFTISTAPEIRSMTISVTATGDEYPFELSLSGDTWSTQLDLSQEFEKFDVLRPISTFDGQHWYAASYDSKGNVSGLREVDPTNISKEKADGIDDNYNYLIMVDFYVRTKSSSKKYDFVLSNPESKNGVLNLTPGETHYGSFVLWDPVLDENDDVISNEAMSAVRIGMQRLAVTEGNKDVIEGPFYIYEPNADMRSAEFKTYMQTHSGMEKMSYLADTSTKVDDYKNYSNVVVETMAPMNNGTGYVLTAIPSTRLIRQSQSSWNTERVKEMLKDDKINSTAIGTIGAFLDNGVNSRIAFARIEPDKVQKMRMYVWIEGQDVDCWNQIASGSIYANLEFYGREVSENNQE